jgi:hypothetical protein
LAWTWKAGCNLWRYLRVKFDKTTLSSIHAIQRFEKYKVKRRNNPSVFQAAVKGTKSNIICAPLDALLKRKFIIVADSRSRFDNAQRMTCRINGEWHLNNFAQI